MKDGTVTVSNLTHQICALCLAIEHVDPFRNKYSDAESKVKAVTTCLSAMAYKMPEPMHGIVSKLILDVVRPIVTQMHAMAVAPEHSLFVQQNGGIYIHAEPPRDITVSDKTNIKYALKRDKVDTRDHVLQLPKKPSLPSSVDLRTSGFMPRVLDQGLAGTCAAHASANALHFLLKKEKVGDWSPSRLYIYFVTRVYVEHTPASEDSGVCIRDVCKALKMYHACDEKFMPYRDTDIALKPSALAVTNANLHKQIQYSAVPQSLTDFKTTLAAKIPIIVGIQVYESFESDAVASTGQVPMPNMNKEQCLGGHAVLLTSYDDTTKKFTCANSWGNSWGDKGFFHIDYDYLMNPDLCSDCWAVQFFD